MATSYVAAAAPPVTRRALRAFTGLLFAAWAAAALLVVGMLAAPRAAGYQMLIVRSGSMEPAIHTGSAVLVQPVPPDSLRVGDVITYDRPEGPQTAVTHRIVERIEGAQLPTFRTKGDANNIPDPYTVTFRGTGWKVVATLPYAGYLINWLSAPLARAVLIGAPAVFLTASFLRDIWRGKR
ncbi:MAG TPA: signal peptidase I [Chloroflexota bacterium]|nr:signal peptidase I [Chloroflexota bacterium]